jgi:hypothetical protein
LLDWTQAKLAEAAGLALTTVVKFERSGRSVPARAVQAMRLAFEAAGVEFIPENGSGGEAAERKIAVRIWFSGPRILGGLIRPGVSFGCEDGLRALGGRRSTRLPSWRRYELQHGLQEAAKARGEKLTKEDANYLIDKALATGLLDRDGNLNFIAKGTRDEMAEQILTAATTWGKPMTRAVAEATADAAIAAIERLRTLWWIGTALWIAAGLIVVAGYFGH